MNINEFGNTIRVNLGEDITGFTHELHLISPAPVVKRQIKTAEDGLVIGVASLTIGDVTLNPGEYLEYVFKEGDIFIAGEWRVRVYSTATDNNRRKLSSFESFFTVDP